jgi:predicted RNA-binding Zn ribbon-like protein
MGYKRLAMNKPPPVSFELIAGHPAVDFVNTVGGLRPARTREKLNSFADLVAWGLQTGVLTPGEGHRLTREAASRPAEAERAVEHARTYREAAYRVFLATAEGRPAPPEDVVSLEDEVRRAWVQRRLRPSGSGYAWAGSEELQLDTVVSRVALAAAELLTSPVAEKVRVCDAIRSEECGWLYLDQTRNHSRRWCEMESCGNRHKARRHYARVRGRA